MLPLQMQSVFQLFCFDLPVRQFDLLISDKQAEALALFCFLSSV